MAILARDETRRCSVCGCSDDDPCVDEAGACYWVEDDLCSACAERIDGEMAADSERGGEHNVAGDCPAAEIPAPHNVLWVSEHTGYCVRCREAFAA